MTTLDREFKRVTRVTRREIRREWRYVHAVDVWILLVSVTFTGCFFIGLLISPLDPYGILLLSAVLLLVAMVVTGICLFGDPGDDERTRRQKKWDERNG